MLPALGAICAVLVPSARATTTTLLAHNCAPIGIAGGQMVFNQRQPNGLWDARIGDRSCSGAQPVPGLDPWDGHRGAASLTADGRWLLVERAEGFTRTWSAAEPGRGSASNFSCSTAGRVG